MGGERAEFGSKISLKKKKIVIMSLVPYQALKNVWYATAKLKVDRISKSCSHL